MRLSDLRRELEELGNIDATANDLAAWLEAALYRDLPTIPERFERRIIREAIKRTQK